MDTKYNSSIIELIGFFNDIKINTEKDTLNNILESLMNELIILYQRKKMHARKNYLYIEIKTIIEKIVGQILLIKMYKQNKKAYEVFKNTPIEELGEEIGCSRRLSKNFVYFEELDHYIDINKTDDFKTKYIHVFEFINALYFDIDDITCKLKRRIKERYTRYIHDYESEDEESTDDDE